MCIVIMSLHNFFFDLVFFRGVITCMSIRVHMGIFFFGERDLRNFFVLK